MSLLSRDPAAPKSWQDELPVTSRYTLGLAGERFFREIKDNGRFMGTHCAKCKRTYVPAASFCERCLSELNDWLDVGTTGEIYTFTILYESYTGAPVENPVVVAFIQIGDGGIIHRVADVSPDEVRIGMSVEAVFKPKEQRAGSILDIEHFRPVS
jgi:hypothetical protein